MKLKLLTLAVASLVSLSTWATEIVHYDNKPIVVKLQKGSERMIQFGDHVQVGVTGRQEGEGLFRVQSAQGAVHILPNKAFDRERIQIKRMNDGRVVLIDLISVDVPKGSVPLEDMRVYLESENTVEQDVQAAEQATVANQRERITPITLTRYAAQKLYAPARLHKVIPGISEANLNEMVNQSVRAFKGINRVRTDVKPVLAYRAGDLYVAALLIKNTTHDEVQLNYLDINLPFSHATYQHHTLTRQGTPGDRTILYLVNDRPLTETLVPWTYYTTAQVEEGAAK